MIRHDQKPRIGLLGLMLEAYEPIFPGITERQEAYAKEVAASLNDIADVVFPGVAFSGERAEAFVKGFNDQGLDGILIVLLTYAHGGWIARAMRCNRLPLALAVIQPDQTVGEDWEELDFTVNQGIHGSQDNANTLLRLGIPCIFFAGNRHEARFHTFVQDFAKAAQTVVFMRSLKVALIGRMPGMTDLVSDDFAFMQRFGPETCHESVGSLVASIESVTQADIDERVAWDRAHFEMDPKLSFDAHAYAVRLYLGIRRFLEAGGYGAYSAHFDDFTADRRIRQLPLLAASHLMADGYGYAAEGDSMCAAVMSAGHRLTGGLANFSEMYAMDHGRKALVFCHAGEGNWGVCEKGKKPHMIDRYLGEGGLENPPTALFAPQSGPAVLAAPVSVEGRFRLLLSRGEILPEVKLNRCEMPYFFYRPDNGIEMCAQNWLQAGGPHHETICIGDFSERFTMLARLLGVELVRV